MLRSRFHQRGQTIGRFHWWPFPNILIRLHISPNTSLSLISRPLASCRSVIATAGANVAFGIPKTFRCSVRRSFRQCKRNPCVRERIINNRVRKTKEMQRGIQRWINQSLLSHSALPRSRSLCLEIDSFRRFVPGITNFLRFGCVNGCHTHPSLSSWCTIKIWELFAREEKWSLKHYRRQAERRCAPEKGNISFPSFFLGFVNPFSSWKWRKNGTTSSFGCPNTFDSCVAVLFAPFIRAQSNTFARLQCISIDCESSISAKRTENTKADAMRDEYTKWLRISFSRKCSDSRDSRREATCKLTSRKKSVELSQIASA